MRTLAITFLLLTSCSCPPRSPTTPTEPPPDAPPPATGERTPAIPADNPHFARVEGTSFNNACKADAECFKAGCSSEVCSAQNDVVTTCELPAEGWPTAGASCGCVENQCVWYREGDGTPPPPTGGAAQGMKCDDGKCAEGLSCLEYYGIAGPNGPKFTSCEIPCLTPEAKCPDGQTCITIADGPGAVCRPSQPQ